MSRAGIETTSLRRLRALSSRASARARPMWPWLARAQYDASAASTPSTRARKSATSSDDGRREGHQPAAGPDGRQQVFDGRRAEHPDHPVGRLLDRLEQGVGGLVGEPVGVFDDHHLPAPADRGQRGAPHEVTHLVDADGEPVGAHDRDVGVGARQDGVARVAHAAPRRPLLALECGGEGDRGVGPARARRAREQEGLTHAVALGGPAQRLHHPSLAHQGAPHATRSGSPSLSVSSSSRRLGEQRLDPGRDHLRDLLDRTAGVDDEVVVGIGGRQRQRTPRGRGRRSRTTRPRSGHARRNGPDRAPGRGRGRRSGGGAGRAWPTARPGRPPRRRERGRLLGRRASSRRSDR